MSKSPELNELVDQVGNFIQYWGFKNVQGRIWAHLFLSETPLDAAGLMKRLDISKALVSLSIKELLQYQVILEVGKSERGSILYKANPDTATVILNVLRGRERLMLSRVSSAYELCKRMNDRDFEKSQISRDALERLGQLVQSAEACIDTVLHSKSKQYEFWSFVAETFKSADRSA